MNFCISKNLYNSSQLNRQRYVQVRFSNSARGKKMEDTESGTEGRAAGGPGAWRFGSHEILPTLSKQSNAD